MIYLKEEIMKSPLVMRLLSSLLDDIQRLEPDVKGLDRDVISINARFEHEGIGFLSVALSSLCDALDRGLASGRFACPHGFSKCRGGALPKLFSGLLCKVFEPQTGHLRADPSVSAVKSLREALRLFKKFQSSTEREESLSREAIGTFWQTDQRCSKQTFCSERSDLLSRVGRIIHAPRSILKTEELVFRHGPGAVFEKVVGNQKWSSICAQILEGTEHISRYGLDNIIPSDGEFVGGGMVPHVQTPTASHRTCETEENRDTWARASGAGSNTDLLDPAIARKHAEPDHRCPFGKASRVVTVAKNSVSRRTITVEPLLNQFVQQGLNTWLRETILKNKVAASCLDLSDQSQNQKLALEGSRTGEWATLDLSSASDLLSVELFKIVFAADQQFITAALECRSAWSTDGSKSVRLAKFAGMGNALTFPVQSICFASIAIAGILYTKGFFRPSWWDVRRIAKKVRVYGDDIIVPTEFHSQVVDWIESFGLIVNRKKSFTEGNFRESCGVDAFKGYDVTPVYLRHDPETSSDLAKACASAVSTSNHMWMRGLYSAATTLASAVESRLNLRLPLVNRASGALGLHSRIDACEAHKWDPHLQRLVYRAPVVQSLTAKDRLEGLPALLKFFLTPLIERGIGHLKRSKRRFKTRIALRWMPTEVGNVAI
jgi:hypothetical protein